MKRKYTAHPHSFSVTHKDVQTCCATCQKIVLPGKSGKFLLPPLPVICTAYCDLYCRSIGELRLRLSVYLADLYLCNQISRGVFCHVVLSHSIIGALVQLFVRIVFAEEILTELDARFTSQLMGQLYQQLGLTAIKTSPYHPQKDDLVERIP